MYGKNLWFICRYVMSRIAERLISIEERWLSCTKLKKEVELGKSSLWIFLLFTMKVELIINSLKWSAENHNAMDYNVMSCNAIDCQTTICDRLSGLGFCAAEVDFSLTLTS